MNDAVAQTAGALTAARVRFELIPHRRTTSAGAEARALGVQPAAIGKTIVVRADRRRIRVVVPASRRLDLRKLARVTGTRTVLLTEAELAEQFPGYELGAVPPFGGGDDCVLLDAALAEEPSVIVEAGSHEVSLRLAPRDLVVVANAQIADVADDPAYP
ncbi:MAG: YbaK/EbsC family protein [Actinomycetota bacterium]